MKNKACDQYDSFNIWELVKSITEETRKESSQIPWKAIAGMRDVAAHK